MIDLHSHVLPGIDDGPPDVAGAVAMVRAAAAAGTTRLVATPHVSPRYPNGPEEIADALERLTTALAEDEGLGAAVEVLPGAEIALTRLVDLGAEELDRLGLGGGRTLLVEAPLTPAVGAFEHLVFELQVRGHRVLLAHPERCPAFQRDPGRLRELVERGAFCQLTAGSLSGQFGGTVRAFTVDLLRDGLVHCVASDAHDPDHRPPDPALGFGHLRRELPWLEGRRAWLTEEAPAALLEDRDPPPPPPVEDGETGRRRRLLPRRRRQADRR